jgi:hypothetical protein
MEDDLVQQGMEEVSQTVVIEDRTVREEIVARTMTLEDSAIYPPVDLKLLPLFELPSNNTEEIVDNVVQIPAMMTRFDDVQSTPSTFPNEMKGGKGGGTKDIFSMGGWKGVQTSDEEDEEIPEIDMGFDTDEE